MFICLLWTKHCVFASVIDTYLFTKALLVPYLSVSASERSLSTEWPVRINKDTNSLPHLHKPINHRELIGWLTLQEMKLFSLFCLTKVLHRREHLKPVAPVRDQSSLYLESLGYKTTTTTTTTTATHIRNIACAEHDTSTPTRQTGYIIYIGCEIVIGNANSSSKLERTIDIMSWTPFECLSYLYISV